MNTPLRYYTNTLRAAVAGNGIPVRVEISDADFYRFLSIPEGVEVSINEGPFIPLYLIPSYQRKPNEEQIRVITIKNLTAQDLVYRLVAGLGALPPSFENEVKEPRTEAVGWSGTSIAAGAAVTFVPLLSGMRTRRKAIVVSNRDPSADLLLRDASNNVVGVISGGEKQIFPISETVNLFNAGGSAVACAVGEIYWLG
jgi:hypothetical protein